MGRVGIEPTTNGLKVAVGFYAVFVFKHLPGRPLHNSRTMQNDAELTHAKLTQVLHLARILPVSRLSSILAFGAYRSINACTSALVSPELSGPSVTVMF